MSISAKDRSLLVQLARKAVEAEVCGKAPPEAKELRGVLGERRGCFVTLTNRGRLRGCIGTFQPADPLGAVVVEMGAAAARDPRFVMNPITPQELGNLSVQVSVLSPLTETKEPDKLQVGVHGIYIVCGGRSGCFLPEVASDMGWDAQTFLDQCCAGKAGLSPGAWRQPGAKVYLFTSEKFDR